MNSGLFLDITERVQTLVSGGDSSWDNKLCDDIPSIWTWLATTRV